MSPGPPHPSCRLRLTPESPLQLHPGWGLQGWALVCGSDDGGGGDGDDGVDGFSSGSLSAPSTAGGREIQAINPKQIHNII